MHARFPTESGDRSGEYRPAKVIRALFRVMIGFLRESRAVSGPLTLQA